MYVVNKRNSHTDPHMDNSGVTRSVAPPALASFIAAMTLLVFPSKSKQNWLRLQVATVARWPIIGNLE